MTRVRITDPALVPLVVIAKKQTALRCIEIILAAVRHYENEDCSLTMKVGLNSIARDIRSEFEL